MVFRSVLQTPEMAKKFRIMTEKTESALQRDERCGIIQMRLADGLRRRTNTGGSAMEEKIGGELTVMFPEGFRRMTDGEFWELAEKEAAHGCLSRLSQL